MIRANFVIPTLFYWNMPFKQQPLTQLYLTTIVDEHFQGKDVGAQITDLRGLKQEEMSANVPESDVYLYSIASPDFAEVSSLVTDLRRKYPASKHVAGGAHVNIFPKESSEFFDSVVLGAGEKALIEVIEDMKKGDLKKVYQRKVDYDSEKFPFPKRNYLPIDKIVRDNLIKCAPGVPATSTLFSFGCPFSCNFCANYNKRKNTRKTNEEMSEEIEYLINDYGVKGLAMLDEICIPLNEREAKAYLETLGRYNLSWRGQSRIGIKPEVLKLAREVGCLELNIGVESVSQRVVDIAQKRIKIEQVKKMIHDCKSNDIKAYINLVNGLPGEPKDIAQQTIDFIEETKPDLVNLFSLCPYPGSPISQNPEKYGINPKSIKNEYHRYNHLVRRFKESQTRDGVDDLLLFEYLPEGPFGKTLTRAEILANFERLQRYIIERGLNK